jgi:hypothetical protein
MYNILLGCDESYYNKWAINCIKSIQKHVPWIDIHVVVVNGENVRKLPNVNYYYESFVFSNDNVKVAYCQALRFVKCSEVFSKNELVMSIDCDTVLTQPFEKEDFERITKTIHVQRHQKDIRWMAGLVTYGQENTFRTKFRNELLSLPVEKWAYGHDQNVLNLLEKEFNYKKLYVGDWMSFGRGKGKFLTLKGDQKTSQGYLDNYHQYV